LDDQVLYINKNHIDGVVVSLLALSVVDHGFEPQSGKTKGYKIGISSSPLSTQY
jgi:hypothetical protein